MTRYYSRWHINPVLIPTSPEERIKLWHGMVERVKAEMKAGKMDDWGIAPNFTGFSIREMNEKEALAETTSWAPYIIIDSFEPVLNPDQALESMKLFGTNK
jgi:hypothetical protein